MDKQINAMNHIFYEFCREWKVVKNDKDIDAVELVYWYEEWEEDLKWAETFYRSLAKNEFHLIKKSKFYIPKIENYKKQIEKRKKELWDKFYQ